MGPGGMFLSDGSVCEYNFNLYEIHIVTCAALTAIIERRVILNIEIKFSKFHQQLKQCYVTIVRYAVQYYVQLMTRLMTTFSTYCGGGPHEFFMALKYNIPMVPTTTPTCSEVIEEKRVSDTPTQCLPVASHGALFRQNRYFAVSKNININY
ncbi:hypothetical protein QTP88_022623 [Uroleucon formosanum]